MDQLIAIFAQKRANREADGIVLPQAFRTKFPDMKTEKAEKLFRRYLDAVADALLPVLGFASDGIAYLSTHKLFNACGTFNVNKARYSVWNEFKDLYPFFNILDQGSNLKATNNPWEKNTKVKIMNEDKLAILVNEKSPEHVFDALYDRDDMADAMGLPIDMANLERFIGNTEYELTKGPSGALRAKLEHNARQARLIAKVGQFTHEEVGEAVLPLIPSKSPFGRTYYKGLNIQSVSKQVRSAILGHHYQYDMNAAVFAIKLFLYGVLNGGDNEIRGTMLGTQTRQYLAEKNHIRQRLARECFEGIIVPKETALRSVKDALTAIGFGARTSGATWMGKNGQMEGTALTEVMKSPVARERFLADKWVQDFLAEQRVIEDAILENIKASEEWPAIQQIVASANKANGRVTRGGLLAYVYQQWETDIMDLAVGVLERNGIEVVARIHDAFIVRHKLSARIMDDIADAWDFREYMTLDCDEVREWVEPSFKRALDTADADLEAHRKLIEQSEQQAALYSYRKRQAGIA